MIHRFSQDPTGSECELPNGMEGLVFVVLCEPIDRQCTHARDSLTYLLATPKQRAATPTFQ